MSASEPEVPAAAAPRRSRGAVLLRAAGIAVAVLAIALCVKTLSDQWSSIRSSIAHANVGWIVVGLICSAGGMTCLGLLWWRCLHVFGSPQRRRDAIAWYYGGELGKYLPGGIWPVLGRGELAQRGGVSRGSAYATTLISYAVMCIAAALVCGVLAPIVAADGNGLGWGWALLLLIPLGLAAVHPVVLGPILALGRRVTRGRVDLTPPAWSTMLSLIVLAVPTWLLVGAASAAVTEALGYHQQPARVMFAAVAAWILGFLAVPVPAGAGLRELVFVGLAGLAHAPGVAVAAIARVLLIIVDAVGGIVGLWFSRRTTTQALPDLTRTGDR